MSRLDETDLEVVGHAQKGRCVLYVAANMRVADVQIRLFAQALGVGVKDGWVNAREGGAIRVAAVTSSLRYLRGLRFDVCLVQQELRLTADEQDLLRVLCLPRASAEEDTRWRLQLQAMRGEIPEDEVEKRLRWLLPLSTRES